ncbi:MAG: histidinol dehydrogenase [Gammaproteobacteria bacterium]|nr:histidinol dehydrogenase [Gammaproteobacteria bacterium]
MLDITRLHTRDADFSTSFESWLSSSPVAEQDVTGSVAKIIEAVRTQGDAAILELTERHDHISAQSISDLEVTESQVQQALQSISDEQREALDVAASRIRKYAERQRIESWTLQDEYGNEVGQKVTALQNVGVYVPGGTAAYPSSVLMNVIPAKVAGVESVCMVVPAPHGRLNPMVLAAGAISGVDRIFTIGGAQAVAALAYGTDTIPKVDKIVGPGNAYVACAKRMVFGQVGIDMIAGPSEVLVICDGNADAEWVAMDLFSQAEHDPQARAMLIATEDEFMDQVLGHMQRQLEQLDRAETITQSMNNSGVFIGVSNLQEAVELSNRIAPEHLALCVREPDALLEKISNAGAIFLGNYSPEVLGDYCAGPNHVLPTSTTARYSSPLGVYDFQKRTSVVNCSRKGAAKLGKVAAVLAHSEGLSAHARSAEYRCKQTTTV